MSDFRIDSVGLYRNRNGEKVEIINKDDVYNWIGADHNFYHDDGRRLNAPPENDITAKWEEDLPKPRLWSKDIVVTQAQRISELEGALRNLALGASSNVDWYRMTAKKALGELSPK